MHILITGATGFIGSKVLQKIICKYSKDSVIALSSKNLDVKTILHKNYNFDKDYLLKNGCENIEVLIHIGGFIPKTSSEANNINNCTSNINNTLKLLNSNLPNLKKIIFISTVDVYSEDNDIISESSKAEPVSLYGWSKLYCEKLVENYSKESGITCQILRLGHVFGEGEEKYKKILPLTIKKIINNEDIQIWGDGNAIRTYVYIEDVAEAIVNSIYLNSSNTINIVGDEQITMNELINKLVKISNKNVNILHVDSKVPNRNLVFDNNLMKKNLLPKLTKLDVGLKSEYHYMENL